MLPVTVTPCPAGTEPNQAGNDCVDCASGTYSLDGSKCEECPTGALSKAMPTGNARHQCVHQCPAALGGRTAESAPPLVSAPSQCAGAVCLPGRQLQSEADFWRSATTSVEFHACRVNGVCLPGDKAGDEACTEGHQGPLCNVCWDDWFKFSGGCK